jgi:hypothetical protein
MSPDEARLLAVQIAEPIITYIAQTKIREYGQITGKGILDQIDELFDLGEEDRGGFAYCVVCELKDLLDEALPYIFEHPEAYVTVFSGHIQYYILKHQPKVRVFDLDQPIV